MSFQKGIRNTNSGTDQFVHLHLHTQYSLLDGANKIEDIVQLAHRIGQPAIALTDHGNLHGALEFYETAKQIGIKPLVGCEIYYTPGSRFDRTARAQGGAGTYHLTVLAKNFTGYRNLCKLSSFAYKEGFYFKPRVDAELLQRFSEGLIVLSGCLNSQMAEAALTEQIERARELAAWFEGIFGRDFFLEVQPHQLAEQAKLNSMCFELANEMGIAVVATNDCHYPNKDDHYAQEVLMCISTGKMISDPTRIRHEGVELYLKSAQEVLRGLAAFNGAEEAVRNSLEIAQRCELEFDFSKHYMPPFTKREQPERQLNDQELVSSMAQLAREGLERRFVRFRQNKAAFGAAEEKMYQRRLEEEITLIEKMGFAGYFLVVADFIVWAKEQGIPVGPGRGSVAGSLVAYAMRITEVDPLEHKLLFERFLNPERISLPDIDVDFCINGRDRVIEYVVGRYGKDRVAQIATFGTLKAKAAIKDVGRVLGLSYAETDRVAQLIPAPRQGFDYPLKEALQMEPKLKEYAAGEGKELISLALKLEGLTRHSSTHAAGVVIGDRPLVELLPMMIDKDQHDVTQYSMSYVEKAGLVKFDFLGLKTLTVIHTAIKIIHESRNVQVDLENLSLNDPKTYALLCAGNTTGVFQLESSGITDMTIRLKPSCFDDIVAILALYRPGPLDSGMAEHYISRKHGREPVSYPHPLMKGVLSDTYGIMLYQEQIMQLARELAGYSLGEADLLRKAMGKKDPEEMARQRMRFINGAVERKVPKSAAEEIFNQMETFARYGFNRSHSAAYAMVSFQTAYLKAHYPVEFMAALMSHEMDDSDKTLKNLTECRKQGVKVLPPDVNISTSGFSVREGAIRYGLEAVKGIGERAVQAIITVREEHGAYKDLDDFSQRVDLRAVNRRVIESLIKSGAFDFSGESRRSMLERLDDAMRISQAMQREKETQQISLFGAAAPNFAAPRRTAPKPEWPINQRLAFEREALGFYISGHPLEKFSADLKRFGAMPTIELRKLRKGTEVRTAGVVTALKLKNTKKGERYAVFSLEDRQGTVESIIWPDIYKQVANQIQTDDPMLVRGTVDVSDERCTLIVQQISSLIALRDQSATRGLLALGELDDFEGQLMALLALFQRYKGPCPIQVKVEIEGSEVSLMLKDQKQAPVCVVPSEHLCDEVEQLFGRPVLSFL